MRAMISDTLVEGTLHELHATLRTLQGIQREHPTALDHYRGLLDIAAKALERLADTPLPIEMEVTDG